MNIKAGSKKFLPLEVIPHGVSLHEYIKLKTQSADREDSDDAFYIMDIQKLVNAYKLWTETFTSIKPYYAVQCNNNPVVLSILAHLGIEFGCSSKNEIQQVLDLGVSSSRIIFANACKRTSHIKYASKNNVSLMTFDNPMELYKIAANFNKARLLVRITADDPHAIRPLDGNFGCSISKAREMLDTANYIGLDVVGVSFHVGSGSQTPDAYRIGLEMCHEVFQYADSIGYHFTILDIGGGFPGSDKELPLFMEMAATIKSNIDKLFSDRANIEIIAEPGRFFSASCFSLAVQVISKSVCDDDNSDVKFVYTINDGANGSFRFLFFDQICLDPTLLKGGGVINTDTVYSCAMYGPTSDSVDKVFSKISFPELNVADWLVFDNMGAYTLSLHCGFNGFKCPEVFYCIKEKDLPEFAEAYTDMMSGDI